MSQVAVKIVVDDAHLDEFEAVATRLRKSGMEVEDAMPEIGVIFGSVDDKELPQIRKTAGVFEAQAERGVQLPPFSDKVPQ